MKQWLILILSATLLTINSPILANTTQASWNDENWADDDWGDDWSEEKDTSEQATNRRWQLNGFIEAGIGDFIDSHPILTDQQTLAEARSRFELNYNGDTWTFKSKAELIYDELPQQWRWHNREINLATSIGSNLDIKIGRQILTWGTGDYLFLNDLFAKDWQSYFSGRDDQYLKAPSDSIKLSYYIGKVAINLAWTPKFTPDQYLTGERFSYYSPQTQSQIAPAEQLQVIKPHNDQYSARISTSSNGIEYALYGYKGNWTTPQGHNNQGQAYFPKLNSWGASIRLPLGDGLLNSEYASYNADKTDPNQANGQHRILLGYEQEIAKNLTASGQIYLERTKAYDIVKAQTPATSPLVAENRTLITLRLRYTTKAQKLTYNLFTFYSPSDQDSYIRPSINYRHSDSWTYSTGANLFTGKHHYSFFGQHQDNSNAWMRVKWSW